MSTVLPPMMEESSGITLITNGLVVYFAFDESSGTVMQDSSGNSNNGTYHGTTTSSGVPNAIKFSDPACRSFNGTSDYGSLSNLSSIQTGGKSFTVTFWLKTSASSATAMQVCGKATWSGDGEWEVQFMSGNGKMSFGTLASGAAFQLVTWGTATNDGNWHFYALVQDIANNRIGMSVDNGAFVYATITHTSVSTTDALVVGASSDATPSHFLNGSLDDFRFYNRVLASSEITQIASGIG